MELFQAFAFLFEPESVAGEDQAVVSEKCKVIADFFGMPFGPFLADMRRMLVKKGLLKANRPSLAENTSRVQLWERILQAVNREDAQMISRGAFKAAALFVCYEAQTAEIEAILSKVSAIRRRMGTRGGAALYSRYAVFQCNLPAGGLNSPDKRRLVRAAARNYLVKKRHYVAYQGPSGLLRGVRKLRSDAGTTGVRKKYKQRQATRAALAAAGANPAGLLLANALAEAVPHQQAEDSDDEGGDPPGPPAGEWGAELGADDGGLGPAVPVPVLDTD